MSFPFQRFCWATRNTIRANNFGATSRNGIALREARWLGRVAWQQSARRPGLDGVDRQGPAADPPPRIGQLVVVVVAQVPDQVDHLMSAMVPMVCDARDASPGGAEPCSLVVDLADDRVLGAADRGD